MRRGHCRRLRAREGRESLRGRAAFARSVNDVRRTRRFEYARGRGRHHLRAASRAQGGSGTWDDLEGAEAALWEEDFEEYDSIYDFSSWSELLADTEGCIRDGYCASVLAPEDQESEGGRDTRATASDSGDGSTVTPSGAEEGSCDAAHISGSSGSSSSSSILDDAEVPFEDLRRGGARARATRWELAVARANRIACELLRGRGCSCTPRGRRKHWTRRAPPPAEDPDFERVRREFLRKFEWRLRDAFRRIGQSVKFGAAPVSRALVSCFMGKYRGMEDEALCPVYHGTHEDKLASIFSSGLLIPGGGSGVTVANGSAYGRGIYAANWDRPGLSLGYSRPKRDRVLLCALLDPGKAEGEEDAVSRYADFVVVRKPECVFPLYEAWAAPMAPGPVLLPAPEQGAQPPRRGRRGRRKAVLAAAAPTGRAARTLAFLSRRAAARRRT